jgi:hypothetical protein
MSLSKLPYELLLSITELINPLRDINALVRTNKWLYHYLNDYLYRLDVQATGGSVLMWAAKRGSKRTAWLSLAEGADIEALHAVMIPCQLRCLGFNSVTTCLSPLQIALCYGSGSVAMLLIEHGAITTKFLGSCTNLHIASAMGLTSTVKALIDHGANPEAQDKQLRTPLHYAVSMKCLDWLEQGRTAMWLLAKNANPEAEDVEKRRPTSIAKRSSNPFLKMLFKKGAEVSQYESPFQDQDILELRRLTKERNEEEAWRNERRKKQLAGELASRAVTKREKDREMSRQKRAAAERKIAITRAREQTELARKREAQERAQKIAREEVDKGTAAQLRIEERKAEKARDERHNNIRENWSRLRKKADQKSQEPSRPDLRARSDCNHLSVGGRVRCVKHVNLVAYLRNRHIFARIAAS